MMPFFTIITCRGDVILRLSGFVPKFLGGTPRCDRVTRLATGRPLVDMRTWPGRLDQSRYAITEMAKHLPTMQNHVLDIATGWDGLNGPAPTIQLAESISKIGGLVTGLDSQIPDLVVDSGTASYEGIASFYSLYDRNGKLLFFRIGPDYSTPDDTVFPQATKKALMKLGSKISGKAQRYGIDTAAEFNYQGMKVMVNPSKGLNNGLIVQPWDLFSGKDYSFAGWSSGYGIARIANLLFNHCQPSDFEVAIKNTASSIDIGGRLLLGYSDINPFPSVGMRNEEYIVYQRNRNGFVLSEFMFNPNIWNYSIGCADAGNYESPARLLQNQRVLNFDFDNDWMDSKRCAEFTARALRHWGPQDGLIELELATSMAGFVAQSLVKAGMLAANYAGMVMVKYDSRLLRQTGVAGDFTRAIESSYIGKGIPERVDYQSQALYQ